MNAVQPGGRRRFGLVLAALALLIGYWLLPLHGEITVAPQQGDWSEPWPHWRLHPAAPAAGETVTVQLTDRVRWPNVLATVNGRPFPVQPWGEGRAGLYTWAFVFPAPAPDEPTEIAFYSHCDAGCQLRSTLRLGTWDDAPAPLLPTKLCAVSASPTRNWHGRSGWDVELTYARLAGERYWGIDDLAQRVQQASAAGLRVLVRVDFAQGQTIPPTNDEASLAHYLTYLARLAHDARLANVYGFVLGSGSDEASSNPLSLAGDTLTPAWYARLVNGFDLDPERADNAVQVIRAQNPKARILVGPVRPWVGDVAGGQPAPWLEAMAALTAALDESAQRKQEAGYALAAPDGFALDAPGRINEWGANEPQTDQRRADWGGAQAGFRIYQDWLAIINAYPNTRGLPVYITAANTFDAAGGITPAANYPAGWLTAALSEINRQPQVQALCWFLDEDRSGDRRWDEFSLTQQPGRLTAAAAEFDALLRSEPSSNPAP